MLGAPLQGIDMHLTNFSLLSFPCHPTDIVFRIRFLERFTFVCMYLEVVGKKYCTKRVGVFINVKLEFFAYHRGKPERLVPLPIYFM